MQRDEFNSESVEKAEEAIMAEVKDLIDGIASPATVIMVTNELGSGVVPEYPIARAFRDIAGRVNQYLASQVDEVYLTVCGLPLRLK